MSICTVCYHPAMAFLVLLSKQSHSLLSDVLRRDLAGGVKLPYKLLSLINCQCVLDQCICFCVCKNSHFRGHGGIRVALLQRTLCCQYTPYELILKPALETDWEWRCVCPAQGLCHHMPKPGAESDCFSAVIPGCPPFSPCWQGWGSSDFAPTWHPSVLS